MADCFIRVIAAVVPRNADRPADVACGLALHIGWVLAFLTNRDPVRGRWPAPGGVLVHVARCAGLTEIGRQAADLAESGLLDAEDAAVWRRLLDPDDAAWLGRRTDLCQLTLRMVHFGDRKAA